VQFIHPRGGGPRTREKKSQKELRTENEHGGKSLAALTKKRIKGIVVARGTIRVDQSEVEEGRRESFLTGGKAAHREKNEGKKEIFSTTRARWIILSKETAHQERSRKETSQPGRA